MQAVKKSRSGSRQKGANAVQPVNRIARAPVGVSPIGAFQAGFVIAPGRQDNDLAARKKRQRGIDLG